MKATFNQSLIALVFILLSCDSNDDIVNDISNPDGFTYGQSLFETPNAYIEVDEEDDNNDGFPDNYSFFFTNGRMYDNDNKENGSAGDFLFSVNTTEWVFLNVLSAQNPSLTSGSPVAGNTYFVNKNNSVILHDGQINSLIPPFLNSGFEFGMGDENIGTFHTSGITGPSITINQLDIDVFVPENSYLDAEYTFINQNGETITGHYKGSLGIILD